ncbi:hypothetical protein EB796_024818 [Bugula neritina]|uniref:Uncharacterized protein n=1 Tax=Bugula neritina TaxID=10212 RepID=A0A7J7ISR8_BUGNE|nr:hypothetical protein EB796_024818 [Bugula neritina]
MCTNNAGANFSVVYSAIKENVHKRTHLCRIYARHRLNSVVVYQLLDFGLDFISIAKGQPSYRLCYWLQCPINMQFQFHTFQFTHAWKNIRKLANYAISITG